MHTTKKIISFATEINQTIKIMEITDATFAKTIAANKVVLVDFWAEWCGPCRMIAPLVGELATEYENKAVIGKVDVDENPEVCEKYGIRNIPTLLFFKNGELVDKVVGAAQKSVLKEKLDALL
ncbi:MAG: thioredoxin [Prevotellaceae bacterium]|nr:thioredoxin [Prevotellaceae bacterium]